MFKRCLLLGLLLVVGFVSTGYADCCNPSPCESSCSTSSSSSCGDKHCQCPCAGKTFMTVRPMYQSARPELVAGFRNDRMVAAQDGWHGAFDFVVFGGRTTNGRRLAEYFLPFCKNDLTFSEVIGSDADILAQNFNIFTVNDDFASTVSFKARHSEVGLGLHYKQGFGFNCDQTKWWYIDVNTPIVSVNNKMTLCEVVTNDGGGVDTDASPNAVANVTQAFQQQAWKFGRIDGCSHKKTGLGDIELKLGREWYYSDCCYVGSYFGILIPTGTKAKGVNVFEPIVGWGKYFAVMWGTEGGWEFWHNCDESWSLALDYNIHSQYFFSRKQVRSFDLKGKPWSRYQEVYANLAQAQEAATMAGCPPNAACTNDLVGNNLSTPGINVFTQCVKVRPGFMFNMTSAFVLNNECGFNGELGWNFFAREGECVKLRWVEGPALKAACGCGRTNSVRNITPNLLLNEPAVHDADFTVITQNDIDINSAAHPAGLAYLVYGTLGWNWDDRCNPLGISFGASYEFPSTTNSELNRWGAWFKFNVAF